MASHLPDYFKCPISLEIMSDPVILCSGHTFDRASIKRWLDAGHRTCPITKLPLPETPLLIPNHALRSLISNYTLLSPLHPQISHPETLISTLSSPSSPADSKLDSLRQLARFSKRDAALRRRLADSGAVSAVLSVLDDCASGTGSAAVQEKALSLLLSISLDDDSKVGLVAEGAVARVVDVLLRGDSSDCRAVAATVVTSLAVVEVNKATIGAFPGAIGGLVAILRDGKGRERKEAATALFALCSFPGNRRRAVDCGAVPVLLLSVDSGLERGVEVIGVLAKCKEGREQMESYRRCVQILVSVVRNGSSRGIQYALLALASLCFNSQQMLLMALELEALELSVGLVDDDNEKVRRNASNLVRVLRGGGNQLRGSS
ncbi:U-box domain-containing protein 8 [Lotus japonicus]|uniref:U-box domain-containing protein 8 n=1 Tax=Lotus japonicus TaxID=34305 RepID=UPI00258A2B54|nr:U-box domain-containing protein 8 [Lotus japonicus]XP_057416954.1 U-box domain-containing protein 8 [Lotus japonicus]XP_057416955.1 U-box domain-containing protein 8 [Lotus japonicus]XP_057416956.1 U-box domain-containing protein 8 [Lotus japonicus]